MTIDEIGGQAHRLEYLGGMIALHGRDAHLRHDRDDTRDNGLVIARNGLIGAAIDDMASTQRANRIVREVRIDA